jgi:hypothetical protein
MIDRQVTGKLLTAPGGQRDTVSLELDYVPTVQFRDTVPIRALGSHPDPAMARTGHGGQLHLLPKPFPNQSSQRKLYRFGHTSHKTSCNLFATSNPRKLLILKPLLVLIKFDFR